VPVHVYTVAQETTRRRVQAVVSLFAREESTLSAQVESRVDKVLVDVGDVVSEGQPWFCSIKENYSLK
jgi:multidrug efflux pump subunit AcrA (membrane-fusion protein)